MSDEYTGYEDRRRPQRVQRDWLGHLVIFSGTATVVIGAAFSGWVTLSSSITAVQTKLEAVSSQVHDLENAQVSIVALTTKAATLADRLDRDERDIADLHGGLVTTATTLQTISNQIAVFDERIKNWLPSRKR